MCVQHYFHVRWCSYRYTVKRRMSPVELLLLIFRNTRSSHKAALLSTYLRNLSVQRSCLQYKSQCLEKVDVKYVINRLWYEIFQIVPDIFFWPMLSLQPRYRDWYGSLELIPGSKCHVIIYIQKISRNHWKLI